MSTDPRVTSSLKRIIKVLKFVVKLDDVEVIKATIEQIIDNLEEDSKK